MYAVVYMDNPEEQTMTDISSGIVLGVKDAVNPEHAVVKVAKDMLSDELVDEGLRASSAFEAMKWLLSVTENHSNKTIIAWEISAEYPEDNFDLSGH